MLVSELFPFLCQMRHFCILENVSALLSAKQRDLLLYVLKELLRCSSHQVECKGKAAVVNQLGVCSPWLFVLLVDGDREDGGHSGWLPEPIGV